MGSHFSPANGGDVGVGSKSVLSGGGPETEQHPGRALILLTGTLNYYTALDYVFFCNRVTAVGIRQSGAFR